MSKALSISDVCMRFPGQVELFFDALSFSLERGKLHMLTGENGVGKSTLLKVLRGDLRGLIVERGEFYSEEQCYSLSAGEQATKIFLVHQCASSMISDQFSFHENLSFARLSRYPSFFKGLSHHSIPIRNMSQTASKNLSGGQKQVLAIHMALQKSPVLLLLDEPTASLDTVNAHEVCSCIQEIATVQNIAVLIITHDIHRIRQYCSGQLLHLARDPSGKRVVYQ